MKAKDWIKVTDRLPEKDEYVLCATKNGKYVLNSMYEPKDCYGKVLGSKEWRGNTNIKESITHWMPITPPKEGEKQKKMSIHPAIANILTVTNYSNLMSSVTSRDRNKEFEEITDKLNSLYTKKNAAYDNSFSKTFNSLGIISAVTRIGDKYNRLENLVKNSNIDNLGESIEDTLMDLASYSIMTLMELNKASN